MNSTGNHKTEYYEGFSLIEMLITIAIMGMLLVLVGQTFAVMVKTSIKTEMKTAARNDVDVAKKIMESYLKSTDVDNVSIYDSSNIREFDPSLGKITTFGNNDIGDPLDEGVDTGNEVHITPFNTDRKICIGYFKESTDSSRGVLMKSSMPASESASSCFDSDSNSYKLNAMVLNSEEVSIEDFNARYISTEENVVFEIEISAVPKAWPGGSPTPTVRNLYVKSNKLQFD